MKEIEPPIPIEQRTQQEQPYKLLGELIHKPGLTMFEYDPETKILKKADMLVPKTQVVIPAPKARQRLHPEDAIRLHARHNNRKIGQVLFKKGGYYFEALNYASACRRLQKYILQGDI